MTGGGGQMRSYVCYCGWSCRKQLQEANKLIKLHMRLTHTTKVEAPEFNNEQGLNGIKPSRHDNLTYKIPTLDVSIVE
jgi:hypothetical protein